VVAQEGEELLDREDGREHARVERVHDVGRGDCGEGTVRVARATREDYKAGESHVGHGGALAVPAWG